MADAEDLKSSGDFSSCGFDSHPGHQLFSFARSSGEWGVSWALSQKWSRGLCSVHFLYRICRRAFRLLLTSFTAVTSVLAADVSGVVTNAQGGEPLARIQVTLLGTTIATVSGPDGRFRFSQLPAGSYVLQVSGVGHRSFQISFQLESPEETKEFAISLAAENFRRTERVDVSGDVLNQRTGPPWATSP
jgi:Carboxypeptidase regulatory-like domain